ncbi:MAG: hypothetical protein AN484_17710 [Aphanizomenon flos-aquae WA102]|jgi:hypothetical protein|uniref:Uncharacterized protein n=1 Tax=Aphanizomenon flos-aquae WA102 TaxID=1710896 RepID=A0A1B7WZB3_APHFL|nr:MAG: hypothetical protein AN484_17710 [Aphanizomenon flos-aquae WA102]
MKNLTSYTVTCICEITGSITVNDCKTWEKAAKKAAPEIQEDIEILHNIVQDFEEFWQTITEDNCSDCGDGEWEVNQTAELSMTVEVNAKKWKEAAEKALEIAQDDLGIISGDDVDIYWKPITEDMVEY